MSGSSCVVAQHGTPHYHAATCVNPTCTMRGTSGRTTVTVTVSLPAASPWRPPLRGRAQAGCQGSTSQLGTWRRWGQRWPPPCWTTGMTMVRVWTSSTKDAVPVVTEHARIIV
jgi:hypothetical protein